MCAKAVRETFCDLYEKGLIYKGKRIINWCPHCTTALSDAEVEYVEKDGNFWHIAYPLKDGSGHIEIATTRPETLLGDSAVAVNPEDPRYKELIGKTCILPLVGREIPIVADEHADMTQEAAARVLKVSQVQVSRLERRAVEELKNILS